MKQILSGDLPNQFENIVESATGDQLNIEWTAHKMFDKKGGLTGIIAIGENITALWIELVQNFINKEMINSEQHVTIG